MMNGDNEIISRRELFKRMARVLPSLALTILPAGRLLVNNVNDCNKSCSISCTGTCIGG